MDSGLEPVKENPIKEITTYTDSRDILAKARKQAKKNNFDDVFIADIDAHHVETESWRDIIMYIDDEVVRDIFCEQELVQVRLDLQEPAQSSILP